MALMQLPGLTAEVDQLDFGYRHSPYAAPSGQPNCCVALLQVPGFTAEVDKQASIYKRWFGVGHVKEWQIPGKRLDQPGSMLHFVPGRGDPVGLKLMSIRDEAGRLCKMSIQLRQMVCTIHAPLHQSWNWGFCDGYRGQSQLGLF